jgi:hypothetical protein
MMRNWPEEAKDACSCKTKQEKEVDNELFVLPVMPYPTSLIFAIHHETPDQYTHISKRASLLATEPGLWMYEQGWRASAEEPEPFWSFFQWGSGSFFYSPFFFPFQQKTDKKRGESLAV